MQNNTIQNVTKQCNPLQFKSLLKKYITLEEKKVQNKTIQNNRK